MIKKICNVNPSGKGINGNVYDLDYLCPTITTNKGEGLKILIKNATKKGYLITDNGDGIDTAYPDSKTRRGRVQKSMSHTITTDDSKAVLENYRIRKLTPRECWRLMGCSDEDFDKAQSVNSNSQLYKQAGNAIVVDVLEAIFKQLFLSEVQNEY
ncbi:DNA-cytosine methyltransferase [Streptococcus phage Javan172]|uniref:DNA cytosine methyltransferase n=1 Tax=Streptococcus dysgalactiae TaxID=1334 RepID=UPI0009BC123B|nr:DNA cytosine methyltransferase [Streptococcus dysgalactiae]QBX24028.1 DNA-cytosine methyltransferase [Streptococcus phage Javan172]